MKQVAERLGLHENTVRRYVQEGMIPAVKFEKAIRIEQEDLEEFIRQRKQRVRR
ncbi:MAG TPA: DNA-binding protein [Candidatus Omnitrophica bacterium]|nr:DNA-binding protein [Candidatus Omnitrophota bacterium]